MSIPTFTAPNGKDARKDISSIVRSSRSCALGSDEMINVGCVVNSYTVTNDRPRKDTARESNKNKIKLSQHDCFADEKLGPCSTLGE